MTDPVQLAKRRRLGRGLGSLMSTPVPIDRTGDDGRTIEVKRPVGEGEPSRRLDPVAMPDPQTGDIGSESSGNAVQTGPARSALGDAPSFTPREGGLQPATDEARIAYLPLGCIVPNPSQPRQHFDESALEALASSIRSAGVMQPIVVRPERGGRYTLIAGERRWRAAGRAGLATIPAVVRDVDDQVAAEWALIENLQREDLNPLEKAEAFRALADTFGLTHAEIAERVGLDRSSVSNFLRLNELDDFCRDALRAGTLMMGHARALLGIEQPDVRARVARLAVRHGWSVRETERQVVQHLAVSTPPATHDPVKPAATTNRHLADLEARLSRHLGTRVRIQPSRRKGRGKLIIDFYSLDEFDGLMQRLGFDGGE